MSCHVLLGTFTEFMGKILCQDFDCSFGCVVCGISTLNDFFYKINLQDRIEKKS